jgi:hypothetical protein
VYREEKNLGLLKLPNRLLPVPCRLSCDFVGYVLRKKRNGLGEMMVHLTN